LATALFDRVAEVCPCPARAWVEESRQVNPTSDLAGRPVLGGHAGGATRIEALRTRPPAAEFVHHIAVGGYLGDIVNEHVRDVPGDVCAHCGKLWPCNMSRVAEQALRLGRVRPNYFTDPTPAHEVQFLVWMTSEHEQCAHTVTDIALTAGRRSGRYLTVCGLEMHGVFITKVAVAQPCSSCSQWREQ
jgi:hypothetical protein